MLQLAFTAGAPRTFTVDDVFQGIVAGTQDTFVILQMPKEGMFFIVQSNLLAIGDEHPFTFVLFTVKEPEEDPIVHLSLAPCTTNLAINPPFVN